MRLRGKTDDNQKRIVSALRQAGCSVLSLAAVGEGCPDLLVHRAGTGRLHLLEIKDGSKAPSRRRLTPAQVAFHAKWPVTIVNDEDEALVAVGLAKPDKGETL